MTKRRWISLDKVLVEAQPLLVAYHQVFGLHHTNHVVRYIGGGLHPAVFVQVFGQVSVSSLHKLEELAGCQVSVRGRAPDYLIIQMFGEYPSSGSREPDYGEEVPNFLYRRF